MQSIFDALIHKAAAKTIAQSRRDPTFSGTAPDWLVDSNQLSTQLFQIKIEF